MKYDDLVEHLGEFGPYQLRVYFLAILPAFAMGIQSFLPVFILGQPEYRCAIPGLVNDTYKTQGKWHQKLINYTLPWTDAIDDDDSTWGSADCSIYKDRTASDMMKPGSPISNDTVSCHRWVYDRSNFDSTFVTKENLVCDDIELRAHANMIYMCGLLVGSIVFGMVSDNYGRKSAFLAALIVHVISTINLAFVSNYVTFVILRFIIGVSNMGTFTCCFVLGVELVGKKYRAQAGIYILFPWCLGMFVLDGVAYHVRDWDTLQIIFSSYSFLLLLLYWGVPESPRWQISQGQMDKARATLEKAAKENDIQFPPGAFDSLEVVTEKRAKFTDIFASPVLVMRCFVIFVNWLVITMVYYGLTLNVGSLGGSVYVNFALSTAVETLGNITTLWALPRVGRKRFHCFSMILGGTACLACLVPAVIGDDSPDWVFLVLSNIGKFGATGGFSTIYVFSAELFPTALRNTVIGTSSMIARLGGIAAPYVADLGILVGGKFGTALPYIVFGASTLVAGFLALTLPETLNQPTPETIEDAINFGKEKPKSNEKSSLNGTELQTVEVIIEQADTPEQPESDEKKTSFNEIELQTTEVTNEQQENPELPESDEKKSGLNEIELQTTEVTNEQQENPELSKPDEKKSGLNEIELQTTEVTNEQQENPEQPESDEKKSSFNETELQTTEVTNEQQDNPEQPESDEKKSSFNEIELQTTEVTNEQQENPEQPKSDERESSLNGTEATNEKSENPYVLIY